MVAKKASIAKVAPTGAAKKGRSMPASTVAGAARRVRESGRSVARESSFASAVRSSPPRETVSYCTSCVTPDTL